MPNQPTRRHPSRSKDEEGSAKPVGSAFGGLLVIIYHWRDRKPSRVQAALTLLGACVMSAYLTIIPFAFGYYLNGLTADWFIGDLDWGFMQVFSLVSLISLSALAVPAAVVVAFTYWLALIAVHRLTRQAWFSFDYSNVFK